MYNVESIHNDTFSKKNYYGIIGDDGCFKCYDSENFITLAEWRDQQINSILKDNRLILPDGFNSYLDCSYDNLTELILPKGFNNWLICNNNNLKKLILPEGFNSHLDCSYNELTELILPEGFNSPLYCFDNNLTELILPKGFNSWLNCNNNNNLKELILPKGFNSWLNCSSNNLTELILPEGFIRKNLICDENVRVYEWNEWLALERERKLKLILDEL